MDLKQGAKQVTAEIPAVFMALKDRDTPWSAKRMAGTAGLAPRLTQTVFHKKSLCCEKQRLFLRSSGAACVGTVLKMLDPKQRPLYRSLTGPVQGALKIPATTPKIKGEGKLLVRPSRW